MPETSYYPALSNLLNEIGRHLKPHVRCIINLRNVGAGLPDGGLFTPDQFQKPSAEEPLEGQLPARGAIEVKPVTDDAWVTAEGEQVSRYRGRYRLILVTNLRDFVLLGADEQGRPKKLESYRVAESERDFWAAAATPRKTAEAQDLRFTEFLKRVMLHAAPLSAPKDVAWFLASYARDALGRVEQSDLPALSSVRTALEEALGLKFEGEKGEHLFRSTLVQTLFYGVFSAWVMWSKSLPLGSKARFDWHAAEWSLHVPMIRTLFEQIATPGQLRPLGLVEVLDWASAALNRVDRPAFFAKFEEGHAVQYFYEPFLHAFDPELRKQLGVWYTPPEIVHYMVERVDRVLRSELDIPDGLADPRVFVLDPCCGTGSYLVEVLCRVAQTLREKGESALLGQELKRAALNRVFGFEILPAPFVVAHWQIGNFLQSQGARLSDEKTERAAVYLTNALTGWEPPKGPKQHLIFPELEQERDAAEHVKRDVPILVILGNPPYNAFAGTSPAEEEGLVEPYKEGLVKKWGIKKFNLDDLYVRFFRVAERRIAEHTGRGIVCYISNFSWLGDPSFLVMRQRFLREFDSIWIDCMNGDSRETGKLTPEGKPDPSVFSTEFNRAGIRVGTAIGLLARKHERADETQVRFRHFWGVTKRADIVESLKAPDFDVQYQAATPMETNRYSFRPGTVASHYLEWPKLPELCFRGPFNGPVERRGSSLVVLASDQPRLALLTEYLNPKVTDDEVRALAPNFMRTSGEFDAPKTRRELAGKVHYDASKVVRYPFKPFDVRLAYLDGRIAPLFSRPSPELLQLRNIPKNVFLISRDTADKSPEGPPFFFSGLVCDYDCISGHARHFPVFARLESQQAKAKKDAAQHEMLTAAAPVAPGRANLSAPARAYLAALGIADPDADAETAGLVWMHALAIGYAPAYLSENADGIRQDWPRVPLPNSREALTASAALGREVAGLLDTESPVEGVTSGPIRPELRLIGAVGKVGGGPLSTEELAMTAGWGHAGKGGATMPGKGKLVPRDYGPDERAAIAEGAARLGVDPEEAFARLGETTNDVYVNGTAFWGNVPEAVWDYTIGGYQVMKKWLSYREQDLLGRALSLDEVKEVTHMARRIAAILLLGPRLDANYQAIRDAAYPWPRQER